MITPTPLPQEVNGVILNDAGGWLVSIPVRHLSKFLLVHGPLAGSLLFTLTQPVLQVDLCPSLSRSSVKPVLQSKWFVHISSESSKYSVKLFGLQVENYFSTLFCANCALCYLQGQGLATLCIAYMNTALPIADTSLPVSDISPNCHLVHSLIRLTTFYSHGPTSASGWLVSTSVWGLSKTLSMANFLSPPLQGPLNIA